MHLCTLLYSLHTFKYNFIYHALLNSNNNCLIHEILTDVKHHGCLFGLKEESIKKIRWTPTRPVYIYYTFNYFILKITVYKNIETIHVGENKIQGKNYYDLKYGCLRPSHFSLVNSYITGSHSIIPLYYIGFVEWIIIIIYHYNMFKS